MLPHYKTQPLGSTNFARLNLVIHIDRVLDASLCTVAQ